MQSHSRLTLVPGVYDVLSALLARQAGHRILFVSGTALAATMIGRPDIGLLSLTELADAVARIRERVETSLIVDADSGYGGLHNLARTVRLLERSGAAVVQIEDQVSIKPKDRPLARPVTTCEEMLDRIKTAVDARSSRSLLVSARTDAAGELGLEEAIERANRYAEAGADLLFVQSLRHQEEAERVAAGVDAKLPLVIHLPDSLPSSDFQLEGLARLGFSYGLQPTLLIGAASAAMHQRLRLDARRPAPLNLSEILWSD